MTRIETTQGTLARRGFTDTARAVRIISEWDERRYALLDLITEAADPDLALTSLDRLEAVVPDLYDRLVGSTELARHVILVLGCSAALGQHLIAWPQHLEILDDALEQRAAPELRRMMLEAVGADPDAAVPVATDRSGDGLRLAYRALIMRIAARDLCAPEPIEAMPQVADELSDLADATLEAALAIGRAKVGENALKTRLAVVGLGKCGAQELNYVSDVDVLFVAESVLDSDGKPLLSNDAAIAAATRMAAELTRICSAHTKAGTIWEVDANLRPEGRSGQLVRTLASHQTYYQKWAKTWEFQAMLKARPSAGDLELGQAFVDMVSPLVWSAAERENFVSDSQTMRKRVVAHIPARDAGRELKLGEGGLRDVEFSVQILQLVHGRADERLRRRATLEGLRQLIDGGYVGRDDGKGFGLAYRFLRTLEHRIQLFRLRRTHVLPEAEEDLRRLGRSFGYADPAKQLLSIWRSCSGQVRRLHERLFYSPLLDAVARIPTKELRLTTQAAQDRLKALGYADPQASLRHIGALSQGVTRQAEIQRQLLPAMLGWFASAPNPDAGLLAFRQVSDVLGATPWYLRALRDEGTMAERLARILASSRYAVQLLTRAPQTVQMLADDAELVPRPLAELDSEMRAAAGRQKDSIAGVEAIRAIRRRELFRVAAGDILGLNDVFAVGEALSDLASATIDATLSVVRHDSGADSVPEIAVIAMGRWGGRELSYASDADAMFVMDDGGPGDGDRTKIAAGGDHRDAEAAHPAQRGSAAEHRCRPPAGGQGRRPHPLPRRIPELLQSLVLDLGAPGPRPGRRPGRERRVGPGLDGRDRRPPVASGTVCQSGQINEIRKLKARVEAERLPRGADPAKHTKLGPGGLADVEWTVQLLQLQHAHAVPALRSTRTITALRAARDAGIVDPQDAGHLEAAWVFASRVRNQIMLVRGRGSDSFPSDNRELAAVAELLGYGSGESSHLLADYRRVTRRARGVVDRVFWGLER